MIRKFHLFWFWYLLSGFPKAWYPKSSIRQYFRRLPISRIEFSPERNADEWKLWRLDRPIKLSPSANVNNNRRRLRMIRMCILLMHYVTPPLYRTLHYGSLFFKRRDVVHGSITVPIALQSSLSLWPRTQWIHPFQIPLDFEC